MLPLSLPQGGTFGQPPRTLPEGTLGEFAKPVLDAKEAKNRQELVQRRMLQRQRGGTPAEPDASPRYLAGSTGRRRSSIAASQVANGGSLAAPSSPHRSSDFPFLNWGADVQCMSLNDVDFLGGLCVVPVHDRKLVKLGILAARSILCMQHADLVLPEVLLADFASVGSGCVLLCEEKSRSGNLGIQPEIMPLQRRKALEALSLEFHLDLTSFLEQSPAPCTLLAVDAWDTVTVRSHLSGNARKLKRAQERMKRNAEAAAASANAQVVINTDPEKPEGAEDEEDEEEEEEVQGNSQTSDAAQQARTSVIESMLRTSRVTPLQLLRKLLNTTEDPEGPLDQTFPNPKKVSHRFVTAITNTVHLFPVMFPIGVRSFGDFLLKRFRPEFLRVYCGEPLVSTACYASCPVGSTNAAKVNCFRATLHLFNHVIPACASTLDLESTPLQGEALCARLHMFGVNLRFLGWVLPWVSREDVTRAVLTEITARSYKKVEERRDKSRHERLTEALLAHTLQMQRKNEKPPMMGAPPLPSGAVAPPEVDIEDDAEDVEFAELTRIAVNKFYPPHLWVPLPRLLASELLLLGRMHPKYGIVMDVLERWGGPGATEDDEHPTDKNTDGASEKQSSEVLTIQDESVLIDGPSSDVFAPAPFLAEPKVIDGVDFSLDLDPVSVPPTPHVEAAYEFDTVLHPSVIDSKQVEVRILDLVRRQRFVFLPGRYSAIALETYVSQSSSACLEKYFQFVQASMLQRHEVSLLHGNSLARRLAALSVDNSFGSIATCSSSLKQLENLILGNPADCVVTARLMPLLKAAAVVAFALYPFESSATLHTSGGFYSQLSVALGRQQVTRSKLAKKHANGDLLSPRGDRMILADPIYWVADAFLAQSKFLFSAENDSGAIASCNDGLQLATNPRQRIQIMITQMGAISRAAQRAIQQAPKPSFGVSLEKRRRRDISDDEADSDDDLHSERSELSDPDGGLPALSTSRSSVGGSSHTRTTQGGGSNASNAPSGASVQPLLLDILRTVPASLPPRHPAREPLYKALLMLLDGFLDREMIGNTMHMLSPTSSQSGSIFSRLAGGASGGGGVGNMSIAEGSVKDEMSQFITERNFASSGVPLECLGALKAQRDDYLACHLSLMRVTNFVSPMAMRFNFDDSKFPELSSGAGTTASSKSEAGGGGGSNAPSGSGGDAMLARNDAMTLIDAFLGTDREGLRYLEDRGMLVFTCLSGKSSISVETTRNILDMRKMNAHSLMLAGSGNLGGDLGGGGGGRGGGKAGGLSTPASENLTDTDDASVPEMNLSQQGGAGGRQMGVHDTLWATERRQGAASNLPRLPLCGHLPIVIDCKMCEPYDDTFLMRALPNVSDAHMKALSLNPKLVLILDGYNPQMCNTCRKGDFKNFLTWSAKKLLLVDDDSLARLSPTDLAKAIFSEDNSSEAILRASSTAVGYALLPWSKQHIFKALQRLEVNQFWDHSILGLRDPIVTRRNAASYISYRWHNLQSCTQRLLQFMSNPRLTSIVGATIPLLVESTKQHLNDVVDGRLPNLQLTTSDVLDCAVSTLFLGNETNKAAQVEALMYAITMATLMSQTAALFVRYEDCAAAYMSALPIRRSRDGTLLTFIDPIFVSYFLSIRSTLELLEGEEDPGVCIGTTYGATIFSKELAQTLKRSGLRRSKSVLAAHAIRELLKSRQQGATVMKAVAKFSQSRKSRKLNGGEWLTSRELSIESDILLIDFLAERCATVPVFRSTLIAFGLNRNLPDQAKLIVPNAMTILSFARYSFSGASLRGVDLSGSNITRMTGCAIDGRCTKWTGVTARNANLSFSDFTSADFRSLDIGSEPKLELLREGVTITTIAFPNNGSADIVYTGDESGRLARWRLDTGVVDHSVTVKFPIAKLAINPSATLIAVACAETNPVIEIREAQGKLRRVAQLVNGHSARVTSICFSDEFELLSAGFDWQVLVWELPQGELQTFIEPVPLDTRQLMDDARLSRGFQPRRISEAAGAMSLFASSSPLTASALSHPARQHVSPKRQSRLAPLHATVNSAPSAAAAASGNHRVSMSSRFLPSTGKRSLLPIDVINATQVWSGDRRGKQRLHHVSQSLDESSASSAIDGKRLWFNVEPSRVARKHHVHITALDCTSREVGLVAFLGGDGAGVIFPLSASSINASTIRHFQCEEVRGGSCVRFSRDGAKLAIPSHRGVMLLDASSGRPIAVLQVPTLSSFGIAHSIDLSDDGTMMAAVCDRTVCIWDVVSGHLLAQTSPHLQQQKPSADSSRSTTPTSAAAAVTTPMLQGDLVACTGFTRRGKALLSTFWGGGVKVMPLLFNDRRDQILTENAEDNIPTVEYRWLLQVNGGSCLAGIGFQGRMDLIDCTTGKFLGTFGTLLEEATLAAGDLHSDMIAVVCPPRVLMYSVTRRQPCYAFFSGARLLTTIAFSPHGGRGGRWAPAPPPSPATTSMNAPSPLKAAVKSPTTVAITPAAIPFTKSVGSGGFLASPLLIGCAADRTVRVWSSDTGVLIAMFVFDASIAHLVAGEHRMLALTGASTSKSLSIATLEVNVFPPLEKKRGGAGKLFITPQGDMIIRLQRILFLCARKRYQRQHHYGNIGALLSSCVLPFLRRGVDVQLRRTSGTIRFPHRDVLVRCAIGGPGDRLIAVTFDQFLSLWSVDHQATHVRTQEVHEGVITNVDITTPTHQLAPDVGALVATTSSDGTTIITATASGSRVVVIRPNKMAAVWCARFHRAIPQSDEPPHDAQHPPQLFVCGSDSILRKWDLTGAPCVLGTRHPIARLGEAQFAEWLEQNDLAPLLPLLRGKLGADLMDMTLDAVTAMLMPLVDARNNARRGSVQRRRSTIMGGGSPLLERRPSVLGNYSTSSPTRKASGIFSALRPTSSAADGDASISATASDVERLRSVLRRAREQSYETTDCCALDDSEITGEQFDTFTPEQLASFFDFYSTQKPQYALLAAVSPLMLERRPAAEAIRKARTMSELRNVIQGTWSYEEMAKSLFHEVSLVRNSRLKQSFLEKPFADIVLFSRTKSSATQFLFQILGLSGKELLDRTQFPNQLIIQCPDCGRKIADARMTCPVRKGNHTHLTPELDSESASGMSRLANMYREHMNTILDATLDILRSFPEKVRFSCGMWWHPMIQDPGLVSVLHFDIPKLTASPTTVVNSATLSIAVTERTIPRMVVVEESHPKLLPKLAGISCSIGNANRMSKLSFPAPPGWKKTVEQSFDSSPGSRISSFAGKGFLNKGGSAPLGGVGGASDHSYSSRGGGGSALPTTKYSLGDHSQMMHPTLPTAALSYSADEVMTTVTQTEVLTTVLSASISMNDAPKPHHRFRRPHGNNGDDETSHGGGKASNAMYSIHASSSPGAAAAGAGGHHNDGGTQWVTADVKDMVNAAVSKGQNIIRIIIVAESIADARELTAAACRPVLSVNFYDEHILCACQSRCVWFPQKPAHLMPELALPPPGGVAQGAVTPPHKTLTPSAPAEVTMGPGYVSPPSDSTSSLTPPPPAVPSTSPFLLAAKSQKQAAAAAAQAAATTYYSATTLCDRFCNVDSRCRGHKCPSSCAACRRAPFMVWETREAKGGTFYHANVDGAINLSAANKNHMKLCNVPYVPPRDFHGPSLQRKLLSLNNISGTKGNSTTPTSSTGGPGQTNADVSAGGVEAGVSPLLGATESFTATPAPTSLLLPASNARHATPTQDPADRGKGTPLTAGDAQGRRKTVKITSFESELQKRGM